MNTHRFDFSACKSAVFIGGSGKADTSVQSSVRQDGAGGPLGGSILGTGLGMGTVGPAATGSPMKSGGRAPAAAHIQLR